MTKLFYKCRLVNKGPADLYTTCSNKFLTHYEIVNVYDSCKGLSQSPDTSKGVNLRKLINGLHDSIKDMA